MREGLTFDDVLLVPQYSEVETRSEIDLSVKFTSTLTFTHPIIPANMLTVTGREMAMAVSDSGGLSILNRFIPFQEQIDIAKEMCNKFNHSNRFAVSVGIKLEDRENVRKFQEVGVRIICVDIAHGDSARCMEMVSWIRKECSGVFVIAGNVATKEGARRLWHAGANAVKVGVGPGSLCTTRIETGNGVPQLTALMEVREAQKMIKYANRADDYYIISDGGIKSAGDVVKALCLSDMVMIGNLFAGCEEAPGNRIMGSDGNSYKEYVGSSTHKTSHVEGVAAFVPYKGTYQHVLNRLLEGLRSGCSYQGVQNLHDLKCSTNFVKITSAGLRESHPHDVVMK